MVSTSHTGSPWRYPPIDKIYELSAIVKTNQDVVGGPVTTARLGFMGLSRESEIDNAEHGAMIWTSVAWNR